MVNTSSDAQLLEDFALKTHSYGRIAGASLASHAIPDAFLVLHTGVGCKYKGAGQHCLHDAVDGNQQYQRHDQTYGNENRRAAFAKVALAIGIALHTQKGHQDAGDGLPQGGTVLAEFGQ